jgi:hypothetical protein
MPDFITCAIERGLAVEPLLLEELEAARFSSLLEHSRVKGALQ